MAAAGSMPAQAFDLNLPRAVFDDLTPGQYADMKVGEKLAVFGFSGGCHDGSTLKIVATTKPYVSTDSAYNAFIVTKDSDYALSIVVDESKLQDASRLYEFVEQLGSDRCGALMELEGRKLDFYDVTSINGTKRLTQLVEAIVPPSNGGKSK